jgi:Rrf2 family protein
MNVFIKREYDYAIRICAFLAGHNEGKTISLAEIAKKLFITRPFATRIVYQLKQAGIVGTVQGKKGGIYLNRPAREVSILTILTGMGFDSSINECIRNQGICPFSSICKIHRFFDVLETDILHQLEQARISEFAFGETDFKNGATDSGAEPKQTISSVANFFSPKPLL